mgnify:CR=1 FL=1
MALKNKVKLSNKVQKIFSGTEVGVLIEEFISQVKFIAEDVFGLHNKVDKISDDLAKRVVDKWLTTDFDGGRHQKRVDMIEEMENG